MRVNGSVAVGGLLLLVVVSGVVAGDIPTSERVAAPDCGGSAPADIWEWQSEKLGLTWFYDATVTDDEYAFAGIRGAGGRGDAGYLAVVARNGILRQERLYSGSGHSLFQAVTATPDGGYLAVGQTNYSSRLGPASDRWAVKFTPELDVEWERRFPADSGELDDVAVASNGTAVAIGSRDYAPDKFEFNVTSVAYGLDLSTGDTRWRKQFGAFIARGITAHESNDRLTLTGGRAGSGVLLEMDARGRILDRQRYDETRLFLRSLTRDEQSIFLTGPQRVLVLNGTGSVERTIRTGKHPTAAIPVSNETVAVAMSGTYPGTSVSSSGRVRWVAPPNRTVAATDSVKSVDGMVASGPDTLLAFGRRNASAWAATMRKRLPNATLTARPLSAVNRTNLVRLRVSDRQAPVGVAEYRWDFRSDGTVDATTQCPNVTHTYEQRGRPTASVTVVDNAGVGIERATSVDFIDTLPPTANFSDPDNGLVAVSAPTVLNASASTDNVGITTYRWDFDGDGAVEKNTSAPTARYRFPDLNRTYNVSVQVVDSDGNTNTTTVGLRAVENDRPSVRIRPQTIAGPESNYRANVTDRVGTTTVTWTFPDGTNRTGTQVRHQFDSLGTKQIRVVVEDEYGARTVKTISIEAKEIRSDVGPVGLAFLIALIVSGGVLLALLAVPVLLFVRWRKQ